MKYQITQDGEWIQPKPGYKIACCDCGLIHRLQFRVKNRRVQFRAWRDNRATAQRRRHEAHRPGSLQGLVGQMSSREILSEGLNIFADNPDMLTMQNLCNLRIAARLKWEQEEMGGLEHVQFAARNNTPIVPPSHCAHPVELVKRGYVDGIGWPKDAGKPDIKLSKWPDGNHWYAFVNGIEVIEHDQQQWNTPHEAEEAAKRFAANLPNKGAKP